MTPKKGLVKLEPVAVGLGPHGLQGSGLGPQVEEPPNRGDDRCWRAGGPAGGRQESRRGGSEKNMTMIGTRA